MGGGIYPSPSYLCPLSDVPECHTCIYSLVAGSKDNQLLVSVSLDGSVRLWSSPAFECLSLILLESPLHGAWCPQIEQCGCMQSTEWLHAACDFSPSMDDGALCLAVSCEDSIQVTNVVGNARSSSRAAVGRWSYYEMA